MDGEVRGVWNRHHPAEVSTSGHLRDHGAPAGGIGNFEERPVPSSRRILSSNSGSAEIIACEMLSRGRKSSTASSASREGARVLLSAGA